MDSKTVTPFTGYQKMVVIILALTQFTVVLDFMIMSPLGDILMKSLHLAPSQFGLAVSAYAFSAGFSGFLTAGFSDRFDRKKLLLFFYVGFIGGTVLCGIAHTYWFLMVARIVTGLFGGVIGSISMAIVADLFALQQRGRVMAFVQMAFGASQVLGIPIGLYIANGWGWEAPFLMVAALGLAITLAIVFYLRPINAHLGVKNEKSAFRHLLHTLAKRDYRIGFTATALLSVGGFMMMPFGSAFAINNLGITEQQLPLLFMVSGVSTLVIMPFLGRLSDKIDKYKLFTAASVWMMAMCIWYTHLSVTPLWAAMVFNILLMAGVTGRMVPSSALVSAVPALKDRGAFMSINASLQQLAGGVAAALAGKIVVQETNFSPLQHYDTVGYAVVAISVLGLLLMYRVDRVVKRVASQPAVPEQQSAG
ncbi:Predicted arabinose efflux permease, MFS family [Parapedobacter composti]|uniref:Predicted arabinose efflux permease, MFS family n=1 Tax=Parapedobacter composti TaxID=623281 RepID=A0A1I1LRN9_9SPHI|nr:MFS transporter [Parapedobacter composti]SFC75804.1 Predicted arabinose efflux permease, MFS family [Parapedobacter composti]